jgi:hypothetical protein
LVTDGQITFNGYYKTGLDGADLILLAQHKNKILALVNTAMGLQVPQNTVHFLIS